MKVKGVMRIRERLSENSTERDEFSGLKREIWTSGWSNELVNNVHALMARIESGGGDTLPMRPDYLHELLQHWEVWEEGHAEAYKIIDSSRGRLGRDNVLHVWTQTGGSLNTLNRWTGVLGTSFYDKIVIVDPVTGWGKDSLALLILLIYFRMVFHDWIYIVQRPIEGGPVRYEELRSTYPVESEGRLRWWIQTIERAYERWPAKLAVKIGPEMGISVTSTEKGFHDGEGEPGLHLMRVTGSQSEDDKQNAFGIMVRTEIWVTEEGQQDRETLPKRLFFKWCHEQKHRPQMIRLVKAVISPGRNKVEWDIRHETLEDTLAGQLLGVEEEESIFAPYIVGRPLEHWRVEMEVARVGGYIRHWHPWEANYFAARVVEDSRSENELAVTLDKIKKDANWLVRKYGTKLPDGEIEDKWMIALPGFSRLSDKIAWLYSEKVSEIPQWPHWLQISRCVKAITKRWELRMTQAGIGTLEEIEALVYRKSPDREIYTIEWLIGLECYGLLLQPILKETVELWTEMTHGLRGVNKMIWTSVRRVGQEVKVLRGLNEVQGMRNDAPGVDTLKVLELGESKDSDVMEQTENKQGEGETPEGKEEEKSNERTLEVTRSSGMDEDLERRPHRVLIQASSSEAYNTASEADVASQERATLGGSNIWVCVCGFRNRPKNEVCGG